MRLDYGPPGPPFVARGRIVTSEPLRLEVRQPATISTRPIRDHVTGEVIAYETVITVTAEEAP